jgi:hypothetical protein
VPLEDFVQVPDPVFNALKFASLLSPGGLPAEILK